MPTTPLVQLPYPAPDARDWNDMFQALVNGIDYQTYTPREDRNIIVMGGGSMGFVASTGVLTWTDNINLLSAVTGFLWVVPGPGTVTLQDGAIAYLTVTRAPQGNTNYILQAGSQTPNQPRGADQILLGVRRGDRVHFRDGFVLQDGEFRTVFDTNSAGGGGSSGQVVRISFSDSPYIVRSNDRYVLVDASLGPVEVLLEASPASSKVVTIKDYLKSSFTNQITVDGNGHLIDLDTQYIISIPGQAIDALWGGERFSLI